MSHTDRNPFSAAPSLDVSGGYDPDAESGVITPIECSCGREHTSAREALDCNHTNHE